MANPEELKILKQGVDAWNKHYSFIMKLSNSTSTSTFTFKGEPDREFKITANNIPNGPDFTGVELSSVDLRNINLSKANLANAILSKVNLSNAKLVEANLESVNLSGADLSGTDLSRANLTEANLRKANLRDVDLVEAVLWLADLRDANLKDALLSQAVFDGANLSKAQLSKSFLNQASLFRADLSHADLSGADLFRADLSNADLSNANLTGANLREANLSNANLSNANLRNANLSYSNFVGVNVSNAILSGSSVYGVNVWDLDGEFREQKDLIITPHDTSVITVDNIKIAQFIYLILNNHEIQDVINTLTSKTVLILGRFIPERKIILDALRNKLREFDLLPIVFDFDRPTDRDFTETIRTLASLSLFVIADITNPKSSPLELQATVPDFQIPFVPIIQEDEQPFSMMADLKQYDWVLDTCSYDSIDTLLKSLQMGIIEPALKKHAEIRLKKAQDSKIIDLKNFLKK